MPARSGAHADSDLGCRMSAAVPLRAGTRVEAELGADLLAEALGVVALVADATALREQWYGGSRRPRRSPQFTQREYTWWLADKLARIRYIDDAPSTPRPQHEEGSTAGLWLGCRAVRVFIAGASGVIGVRLIPLLAAEGHVVAGMTRSAANADLLRELGALPVVCDVFDGGALTKALTGFGPEVVFHQLTDLPDDAADRARYSDRNDRMRSEGTPQPARRGDRGPGWACHRAKHLLGVAWRAAPRDHRRP